MGWIGFEDENGKEIGIYGDTGWDIMDKAIDELIKAYELTFNRLPTKTEARQTLEFVFGGRELPE